MQYIGGFGFQYKDQQFAANLLGDDLVRASPSPPKRWLRAPPRRPARPQTDA